MLESWDGLRVLVEGFGVKVGVESFRPLGLGGYSLLQSIRVVRQNHAASSGVHSTEIKLDISFVISGGKPIEMRLLL